MHEVQGDRIMRRNGSEGVRVDVRGRVQSPPAEEGAKSPSRDDPISVAFQS